jgi:hypothetical protein
MLKKTDLRGFSDNQKFLSEIFHFGIYVFDLLGKIICAQERTFYEKYNKNVDKVVFLISLN